MRNWENVTSETDQLRLSELLAANRALLTVYVLKDDLRALWARPVGPLPLPSLLEGINNKIKVIKRMAYGFRDDDYFCLKIRAAFAGIG